jgi:hypothetical protein
MNCAMRSLKQSRAGSMLRSLDLIRESGHGFILTKKRAGHRGLIILKTILFIQPYKLAKNLRKLRLYTQEHHFKGGVGHHYGTNRTNRTAV